MDRADVYLQVPRRTARDIYGLKLDATDAFFLSNVDNQLSIEELADIIGYDPTKALRSAEALVKAGALELGPPRGLPGSGRRLVVPQPSETRPAAIGKKRLSRAPGAAKASMRPVATSAVEPTEDRSCDLDAETIAKIDAALVGASARTHY